METDSFPRGYGVANCGVMQPDNKKAAMKIVKIKVVLLFVTISVFSFCVLIESSSKICELCFTVSRLNIKKPFEYRSIK